MNTLEEAREFFANDRFATEITGIVIEEASEDFARCSLRLNDTHKNANGFVMGGVLFTLADFTFAVASNFGKDYTTVTNNANINFLEPVNGEYIEASSRLIRNGRTTCIYEIEIRNEKKRVAIAMINGVHVRKH